MLADILHKISEPLSREMFADILFRLINSDCSNTYEKLETIPYNRLKPILNEQYTLKIIQSLEKTNYNTEEISGLLVHLYRYSYVSNIRNVACITLQPHVFLAIDKDGRYFFNYETFNIIKPKNNITFLNNFGYISEPIEFIERPCVVDIKFRDSHIKELELLYDTDKCDQYLAFHMMLSNSSSSSTKTADNTSTPDDDKPSTSAEASSSRIFSLPSATRNARVTELSKTSRDIFSKAYWMGYYYYGLGDNISGSYNYTFDNKN